MKKKGTVQLTRWLCKNHWSVTTTISWWMSVTLQTILTSSHVKIIEAWPPTFHGDCPSHCRQYWHQHMSKSLKSDHQHFTMNVLHIADNTDIIEAWPPTLHGECPWHCRQYQSRKLEPDRRITSDKFPGGPVVFVNSPDQPSGKLFCQSLLLRIYKSRFSVNSS